jgi:antitoxin (DNA-binding transcriptional repressor) of toxin-antitoxin stability system
VQYLPKNYEPPPPRRKPPQEPAFAGEERRVLGYQTPLRMKIRKRKLYKNILTSCQKRGIFLYMKTMAVGEIKAHFSEILQEVKKGKKVGILYGKTKKPIAMIVPYEERKRERKIGILDGKIKIEFRHDFEMTTGELLEIR